MMQRGRAVGGVRCGGLVAGSVAAGRAHGTSVLEMFRKASACIQRRAHTADRLPLYNRRRSHDI